MNTKDWKLVPKDFFFHPSEDLSLFIARHPEFERCLTKNNSGLGVGLLFPK